MTRSTIALALALGAVACKTEQIVLPPPPTKIVGPTFDQKMAWILRFEDQRMLHDPAAPEPPPPPPPPPPAPPRGGARAVVAAPVTPPPPPDLAPDLVRLLKDEEARVRRRAALAVGRVGLAEGVDPLLPLLGDSDAEVRQMAAF